MARAEMSVTGGSVRAQTEIRLACTGYYVLSVFHGRRLLREWGAGANAPRRPLRHSADPRGASVRLLVSIY